MEQISFCGCLYIYPNIWKILPLSFFFLQNDAGFYTISWHMQAVLLCSKMKYGSLSFRIYPAKYIKHEKHQFSYAWHALTVHIKIWDKSNLAAPPIASRLVQFHRNNFRTKKTIFEIEWSVPSVWLGQCPSQCSNLWRWCWAIPHLLTEAFRSTIFNPLKKVMLHSVTITNNTLACIQWTHVFQVVAAILNFETVAELSLQNIKKKNFSNMTEFSVLLNDIAPSYTIILNKFVLFFDYKTGKTNKSVR